MRKQYRLISLLLLVLTIPRLQTQPLEHPQPAKKNIFSAHLSAAWYPQSTPELEQTLTKDFMWAATNFPSHAPSSTIKALIAPHAGYRYSVPCAATAYVALMPSPQEKNRTIKRVIILAPSHHVPFFGARIPAFDGYKTPLGTIDIDAQSLHLLAHNDDFTQENDVFTKEHSLEIQLPLLQKSLERFTLIPIIIGHGTSEVLVRIANAIKPCIDDATLLVISSDFTHYGSSFDFVPFKKNITRSIRSLDSQAIEAICSFSPKKFEQVINSTHATICGQHCIQILLELVNQGAYHALTPKVTCYYTSPHIEMARTHGTIDTEKLLQAVPDAQSGHSVSYVGMIFTSQQNEALPLCDRLTGYEQKSLLHLARASIHNRLMPPEQRLPKKLLCPLLSTDLEMHAGAFVTLKKHRLLRGCIGRIVTDEPLYQTVYAMAQAAAFNDSRFQPVKKDEVDNIQVSISVLAPPVSVASHDDIILGTHGVILSKGQAHAVFLPQVATEQKWDKKTLLEQLALKAGLDRNAWKKDAQFQVFEGCEISEENNE